MKAKLIIATALLAGIGGAPAYANLIQNGDFVDGSTDWTYATEHVLISAGAAATQSAAPTSTAFHTGLINGQPAWLDSLDIAFPTISQTIATQPGEIYQVTYLFETAGFGPGNFFAIFNGTAHLPADSLVETFTHPGVAFLPAAANYLQNPPPFSGGPGPVGNLFYGLDQKGHPIVPGPEIELETFTGVATGTATTLEFAGTCFCSFLVTDVSVEALPEPSTFWLFLPMTMALWLGRRRIVLAACPKGTPRTCVGRCPTPWLAARPRSGPL
jgi:hypothetical protein